ncbi:MAG TPA: ATPase domain-containing protein [Acetobacteraceae bacterium]|jgi:circadian clock protein KaiC|nr:ATPase domain-containing protein [Acetobacteraceae bacterium]
MRNIVHKATPPKLLTGVPGLDTILDGGIQAGRVYLVEGTPGTGKTTLALQFLLAGVEQGQSGLYMTLSESSRELSAVAESHGWSLDGIEVFELVSEEGLDPDQEQTVLHPSELELGEATRAVIAQVDARRPNRVVFDSLSEMRLLAQNPLRYRRQVLALKQFFTQRECTVLMLDDRTSEVADLQLHSIAHGVILLEQIPLEYGAERRRMRVMKLRGTAFRGGWHDYLIRRGGLTIFPRLVAHDHHTTFTDGTVSTGAPGLDALMGGGLVRGTNTLLIGPSGAGKTSTATSAVVAALRRGERAAYFLFDEGLPSLLTRSANLAMDLRPHIESGLLTARQIDPAEMSPGEFAVLVKDAVEQDGATIVVIDSLNAYMQSMPGEQYLLLQMHELLTYLNQCGAITLMILGQHGLIGDVRSHVDLSYLADSVVLLRFFEVDGLVRKAISVVKTRTTEHEATIREFTLTRNGLVVGEPLRGFRGVLGGTPVWSGTESDLIQLGSAAED